MNTKELILTAFFASITCVFSILIIPLGIIPITLQVFAVVIAGAILGAKIGFMSQLLYAIMGAIGLPVFSGMQGGMNVVVGPTGGYIFGFVIAAGVIGLIVDFSHKRMKYSHANIMIFVSMLIGLIIIYGFGMLQLSLVLNLPISTAFKSGVLPFIGIDFVKVILAGMASIPIRKALLKSRLLPN